MDGMYNLVLKYDQVQVVMFTAHLRRSGVTVPMAQGMCGPPLYDSFGQLIADAEHEPCTWKQNFLGMALEVLPAQHTPAAEAGVPTPPPVKVWLTNQDNVQIFGLSVVCFHDLHHELFESEEFATAFTSLAAAAAAARRLVGADNADAFMAAAEEAVARGKWVAAEPASSAHLSK